MNKQLSAVLLQLSAFSITLLQHFYFIVTLHAHLIFQDQYTENYKPTSNSRIIKQDVQKYQHN